VLIFKEGNRENGGKNRYFNGFSSFPAEENSGGKDIFGVEVSL